MHKTFYESIIKDLEKVFRENRESSIHRSNMEYISERLMQILNQNEQKYADPKRKYYKDLKRYSASAFYKDKYYEDLLYFIDKYCRDKIERPYPKDYTGKLFYVTYKNNGETDVLPSGFNESDLINLHKQVGNVIRAVKWYEWPYIKKFNHKIKIKSNKIGKWLTTTAIGLIIIGTLTTFLAIKIEKWLTTQNNKESDSKEQYQLQPQ